jgi:hypothetical protein
MHWARVGPAFLNMLVDELHFRILIEFRFRALQNAASRSTVRLLFSLQILESRGPQSRTRVK